jgi:sulfite dehydrogenase (cytochrome) subunit B
MRVSALVITAAGLALAGAGCALAAPKTYELPDETASFKPGPGMETAQNNCTSCHSTDYVNFQPPKKGQAFWEAEVQKMIKVYHAPIGEADAATIADYLAKAY